MGSKNNPGRFDCYANAHPDEPMFVLLGRDKHAPTLVWLWATLRELDGEDPAVIAEARQCVSAMLQWAHDHGRQAVGIGQAALAAVMELIRAANVAIEHAPNAKTRTEDMRMFLCRTLVEGVDEPETSGDGDAS